jgi:hypothetical protein
VVGNGCNQLESELAPHKQPSPVETCTAEAAPDAPTLVPRVDNTTPPHVDETVKFAVYVVAFSGVGISCSLGWPFDHEAKLYVLPFSVCGVGTLNLRLMPTTLVTELGVVWGDPSSAI